MNKEESLALYEKGVEAWNIWANKRFAIKAKLEKDGQWQIDTFKEGFNRATKDWVDESSVVFSGHVFEKRVDFSDLIFPYVVNFKNTKFSGYAEFNKAIFSGDARFDKATFSGDALFNKATFSGDALFNKATFSGDARFDKATFSGDAQFDQALFKDFAVFKNTTFSGDAGFHNTTFMDGAAFYNTAFSGFVGFDQALFEDFAYFEKTSFKKASFIAIKGQSFFSFKDVEFHLVPDFTQAHFIEAPQFDNSDFSEALKHSQSNKKDNLSSNWRSLKRLAIQGHDHERELIFFAEEIKSQRGKVFSNKKLLWQEGTRFFFGYFYQYLSDFGRSVMRPIVSLLVLGILFFVLYMNCSIEDSLTLTNDNSNTPVTLLCDELEAAIYLSARSSLPFIPATSYSEKINQSYACLYGEISEGKANIPNAVVFFSIVQTMLSTILIFLSLLALRNHFRIK